MKPLAFLTLHHKADAVAPPLDRAGYRVVVVDSFDTDQLGTFTGETPRKGSQIDAALAKARLAATLSGSNLGLGSEGSFGPDPYVGLTAWGTEVLTLWDEEHQYPVHAVVQGAETNYAQATVNSLQEALDFCQGAQWPAHGIIIGKPGQAWFCKESDCSTEGITRQLSNALAHGPLWLETDMRAHRNPTRMRMIGRCAEALANLLQSHCPSCQIPGFGKTEPIRGALCAMCGHATNAVRAHRVICPVCNYAEEKEILQTVPPSRCDYCNP
jgi:hypothetical protein